MTTAARFDLKMDADEKAIVAYAAPGTRELRMREGECLLDREAPPSSPPSITAFPSAGFGERAVRAAPKAGLDKDKGAAEVRRAGGPGTRPGDHDQRVPSAECGAEGEPSVASPNSTADAVSVRSTCSPSRRSRSASWATTRSVPRRSTGSVLLKSNARSCSITGAVLGMGRLACRKSEAGGSGVRHSFCWGCAVDRCPEAPRGKRAAAYALRGGREGRCCQAFYEHGFEAVSRCPLTLPPPAGSAVQGQGRTSAVAQVKRRLRPATDPALSRPDPACRAV